MKKYKITKAVIYGGFFYGFELEDIVGTVDPVVNAGFTGAPFTMNSEINVDITHEEVNEWAKACVGKYLVCHALIYTAAWTKGPTWVE